MVCRHHRENFWKAITVPVVVAIIAVVALSLSTWWVYDAFFLFMLIITIVWSAMLIVFQVYGQAASEYDIGKGR